jgi:hypothetical protein
MASHQFRGKEFLLLSVPKEREVCIHLLAFYKGSQQIHFKKKKRNEDACAW